MSTTTSQEPFCDLIAQVTQYEQALTFGYKILRCAQHDKALLELRAGLEAGSVRNTRTTPTDRAHAAGTPARRHQG